jgi:hypothetical protein
MWGHGIAGVTFTGPASRSSITTSRDSEHTLQMRTCAHQQV